LTAEQLVEEVSDRYGLGRPVRWLALSGGYTTNLRLDLADGRSLVVRVHDRDTTAGRLSAVHAARHAAAAAGVPVIVPIPALDGREHVRLTDGLLAEVEPHVTHDDRMNRMPLLARGFGVLGRLHDVLRTADLPAEAAVAVRANHRSAVESVPASRRGRARVAGWGDTQLTAFADRAVRHLEAVAAAEEPLQAAQRSQVVHGDFWDNNVLIEHGQVVAVIDFEFMAARQRIDDLALPAYFFLLEPPLSLPSADDRRAIAAMVDAYDRATGLPLSPAERAALPLAIARQPAWSIGRHVLELDDEHAREHAREAMAELPVAEAVMADLPRWQDALG
jgi:Ser/Thr protein kinase RdoA (MazF antagonist)